MYNKIFTKILDSSIWLETDSTRIVWLTLIAAMDETGFTQFASPANLAHRARVSLEAVDSAIKVLEGPDLNSSDPDHEGRRIERVSGGWMVLNAGKYRELVTRAIIKENTRVRVAAFRKKKREEVSSQIDPACPCDCCGTEFPEPRKLYAVQDHHHDSGLNRGIICQSCNKIVGLLEKNKTSLSPKNELCLNYINRWARNLNVPLCNKTVTPSEALATAASLASPNLPSAKAKSLVQLRAEALFRKRPSTPLDKSEVSAWSAAKAVVEATVEEDWALLENWFRLPASKAPYRRQAFATLLNNWNAEIERAKEHLKPVQIRDYSDPWGDKSKAS